MNYLDVRLEIDKMKGLYTITPMEEARQTYDQYVSIVITEADLSKLEKETLFEVWEDIKTRVDEDAPT